MSRNLTSFFSSNKIHSDAKYAKPDILEMSSASSSRRSATQTRLSSESPWRPKRANLTGVFIPKNRYEEMLLVLMLSECIARKDAVLSQDPKFVSEREKTYKNATMYELLTCFHEFCHYKSMKSFPNFFLFTFLWDRMF